MELELTPTVNEPFGSTKASGGEKVEPFFFYEIAIRSLLQPLGEIYNLAPFLLINILVHRSEISMI